MRISSFISASFYKIVAVSVALAVVPMLGMLCLLGYLRIEQSVDGFARNASYFMQAAADKQSELNFTTRTFLHSVARSRELSGQLAPSGQYDRDDLNLASIDILLDRLKSQLSLYGSIGLYDRAGRFLAGTSREDAYPAATPGVYPGLRNVPRNGATMNVSLEGSTLVYVYTLPFGAEAGYRRAAQLAMARVAAGETEMLGQVSSLVLGGFEPEPVPFAGPESLAAANTDADGKVGHPGLSVSSGQSGQSAQSDMSAQSSQPEQRLQPGQSAHAAVEAVQEDSAAPAFLAVSIPLANLDGQMRMLNLPDGVVLHFLDNDQRLVHAFAADHSRSDAPADMDEVVRSLISSYGGGFVSSGPSAGGASSTPEGSWHIDLSARDGLWESEQPYFPVHEVQDADNGSFLVSYTGLSLGGASSPYMYLAVSVDKREAYAASMSEVYSFGLRVCVGLGITLFLLWLLCLLFFRRPAGRLLKAAKGIGDGNYTARNQLPANGAFGDFSASLRRIAESLEKHEAEIREAREYAENAGRSKSEFLANMSHEIRTPLNAILGMTYLVQKSALSASQRAYVNKIQSAGKTLLHVVNDILDFSKMEAGKMGMEQIRFAVRDLFSNLAQHYAQKARDSGLDFNIHIAPDVPMYLVGDPLRLEQAVSQLLERAFQNTWRGGVGLNCSLAGIARSECTLRIRISDTGEGMTPGELEVLRAFFSAGGQLFGSSGALGRDGLPGMGGSGSLGGDGGRGGPSLGLTIAHRLFEYMNGSIEVSSEVGRGTVFSCTARFTFMEVDQSRNSIMLASKRVLIADADEVSLALYTTMLSNFAVPVEGVSKVEQALERLAEAGADENPFDFFMLDWRNLESGAAEIIKQVKALGLARLPRFIVTSSMGRDEVRKLAEDAGADVFLHKPMDASVLLDTMMGLFSESESDWLCKTLTDSIRDLPKQTFNGLRVLLAEDNEINRQIAIEIMDQQGISVTCAENGLQVLKALGEGAGRFDVVLMDLQMPEMDGYEATWRIRKDSHLGAGQIPIIAMTAHSGADEIMACRKSGMDDYVSKPIDVNMFYATLGRWLPVLPDNDWIIHEEFTALHRFAAEENQLALTQFACIQAVLPAFVGEGRMKKLQKHLWDQAWGEAAAFTGYLEGLLYPAGSAGQSGKSGGRKA